jgi:hypothetical protein
MKLFVAEQKPLGLRCYIFLIMALAIVFLAFRVFFPQPNNGHKLPALTGPGRLVTHSQYIAKNISTPSVGVDRPSSFSQADAIMIWELTKQGLEIQLEHAYARMDDCHEKYGAGNPATLQAEENYKRAMDEYVRLVPEIISFRNEVKSGSAKNKPHHSLTPIHPSKNDAQ